MRKITRLLSALFLLLIFITAAVFSYFNATPVAISTGFGEFPPQPVSVWIIGAFVIGGVMGLLLGLGASMNFKSRSQARRLNRQLDEARQEVSRLRAAGLKDLR